MRSIRWWGLVVLFLPMLAFGYPAKVWVRNCCDAKATVKLGKNTFEFKAKDFGTIELKAPGTFTFTIERAGRSQELKLEIKDYYQQVTLLDLGQDAAYAVLDVGAYYQDDTTLLLPLVQTMPPALVHQFPFPFGWMVDPVSPLPESHYIGLSGGHLYKVKAIDPKALQFDKKKLAASLSASLLKKELARQAP
jgi:hypothetical protein